VEEATVGLEHDVWQGLSTENPGGHPSSDTGR